MDQGLIQARLRLLSDHFGQVGDPREACKVKYPLREILFLATSLASLIETTTQIEQRGKIPRQTRYFIASARLTPERAAQAIRSHWGVESLHWVLDVIFKEDQSRLKRGHGAHNMALVRRFAFNIVRAGHEKRSIKTARKAANWHAAFLADLIQPKKR